MDRISRILLVLFLVGALASCRGKSRNAPIASEDGSMKSKSGKKFDPQAAEMDARFVISLVSAHVVAVEWTSPELNEHSNSELQDVSSQLHAEHEQLLEKWKAFAEKRNVLIADSTLPALQVAISKYARIHSDSAKARFWVDKMLDQENNILTRLEDYMDDAGDPKLKVLMVREMPVIRENRDELMMLKSRI